jgi:cytoskeleton protein RodZ
VSDSIENAAGPGALLRAARERAGWKAERLAAEMCLPVPRLLELERDEHAGFGGAVFVRGHLRRAAALLRLSPQDLLAAYEATCGGCGPAELRPTQVAGTRSPIAWLGPLSGVTAVAALMAGGWWWLAPELDLPARVGAASAVAGASLEFIVPEPQPSVPRIALQDAASAPVAGGTAEEVPIAATEFGLSLPGAAEMPDVTQDPEPALAAPGTVELRFAFTEDCWLEVSDADGERIAYRLYHPGEVARLRGKAPMRVFLGNADAVQLTVDGAAMAVRPASRRDGTARLTVGGGAG